MGKTKTLVGALLAVATLTVTGCSGGGAASTEEAAAPTDPSRTTGTIKVLTQRTDLVQSGALDAYAAEFNKIYPKVKVKFEGLTDYEGEVKIRMNTEDYGDVLMIPAAVSKNDYPKFFAPLGPSIEMSDKYRFSDKTTVGSKVYGIAQFGTANGFIYNKALWKKAGDHRLAELARGVPRGTEGDQGKDRRNPLLHQLQGRLAAGPVERQHRLGYVQRRSQQQARRSGLSMEAGQ